VKKCSTEHFFVSRSGLPQKSYVGTLAAERGPSETL
jgi:hypothetical protein